jgi:hypothetical protein
VPNIASHILPTASCPPNQNLTDSLRTASLPAMRR